MILLFRNVFGVNNYRPISIFNHTWKHFVSLILHYIIPVPYYILIIKHHGSPGFTNDIYNLIVWHSWVTFHFIIRTFFVSYYIVIKLIIFISCIDYNLQINIKNQIKKKNLQPNILKPNILNANSIQYTVSILALLIPKISIEYTPEP